MIKSSIKSEIFSYRPIMDDMQRVVAYAFISKHAGESSATKSIQNDAPSAIINAFMHTGMNDLFRGRLVFVSASTAFLMSDLPLLLPEKQLVFKLPPSEDLPAELSGRIHDLSAIGYDVAVDNYVHDDIRKSLLPFVKYVLIDINDLSASHAYHQANQSHLTCIASNVDSQALLAKAQTIGFVSYQGHYFAHANDVVSNKSNEQYQPEADSKLDVLDLLEKLNDDGSDKVIEDFFKAHPLLTIQMLRLVNAASTGNTHEINSVHQALLLLGRAPLIRYFQVLLCSLDNRYACPNPLMAAASWRGKFMEIMVRKVQHTEGSNLQDQAYMVGMFSMMSALLNKSLVEILTRFNLSQEISQSILSRTGVLGGLLKISEALQFESLGVVEALALEQNYPIDTLMHAQNEAFAWVQNFQARPVDAN